jgi:hypothetical protein
MEAIYSSEISVDFHRNARRYISEDITVQIATSKSQAFHIFKIVNVLTITETTFLEKTTRCFKFLPKTYEEK